MTDELRNATLFRGMTEAELETALIRLGAKERSYEKGETVLRAGYATERLGLVLSGSVTVESCGVWGNRSILSLVGAGELFAETYALLPREPLMVDVVANEPGRVLFLHTGKLLTAPAPAESWYTKLIRNLLLISANKNIALSNRSLHTSPKTARGRIMAYLSSVSLKEGKSEFDIPFDRQQMADYLNLERTALSKELGKMKAEGLIDFRKNRFSILQPLSEA